MNGNQISLDRDIHIGTVLSNNKGTNYVVVGMKNNETMSHVSYDRVYYLAKEPDELPSRPRGFTQGDSLKEVVVKGMEIPPMLTRILPYTYSVRNIPMYQLTVRR